jgi:nitrite reductase (NADH) small subunit
VSEWKRICQVADIPVLGSRRIVRAGAPSVAVFRTADDRVFALLDRCPHKGGPLSQGIVFGDKVACPLHNWAIGLEDGCATGVDVGCTPKFAVQVVADQVHLDAGELATLGIDLPLPKAGPGASTGAVGDQTFDVQAPHTP